MNQIDNATDFGAPPEMGRIRTPANQIALWSWCAMLFCIPFSTALGLLFSAIAVVSGLVGFSVESFKTTIRQPAIALCVALFVWLTISMLWSIAPKAEMLEAWSKYRKLLYPALALMVLHNLRKSPTAMIFSFLAGTGVVALVSLASAYGLLQMLLGPPEVAGGWYIGPGWLFIGGPENPTFGRNHITQSAFLAFGAMLALGQAWVSWRGQHGMSKTFFWVAGSTLYVHTIFLLQGRTGYLLVAVFTLFWLYVALRYLELKKALLAIVLGASLVSALGISSPHLFSRTHVMVKSVSDYAERGEMTDSGVRLEFWRAGLEIIESRPAWGVGLGGFAEAYSRLEGSPEWLRKNRSQPHSEFVLIATQSGLTGLLILVGLWFYLAYASVRIININPSLAGLTALYFVDAIFNSVIWDLAEGHFLVLLIVCSCVFSGLHGHTTSSSEPKR